MFLFVSLIIFVISYILWKRKSLYILSTQYRGRFSLPLVGNSFILVCKDEEILEKLIYSTTCFNTYDPVKFWMGPQLILSFRHPNHVEKILQSQKFSQKNSVYNAIKLFAGEGLVTASGPTFRKHKRVIVPLFNLKFVHESFDEFQKCFEEYFNELKNYENEMIDIEPINHKYFSKLIGRICLGVNIDFKRDHQFLKDVTDLYELAFSRAVRPWLAPYFIFKMTSLCEKSESLVKRKNTFLQKAIDESLERIKMEKENHDEITPIIDILNEFIKNQPDFMSNDELIDHLLTLFLASEDTLTLITSFLSLCLGMYTEYQVKVVNELKNYFGEIPKNANLDDIGNLPYLDMCVKEALRLLPIAPLLVRETIEECEVDGWKIPKHCGILMPMISIHRDPNFWENPDHFYPDHFLPEAEKERHNYAYIPFSGGTRGCIGKIFANIYLRIFMANFLQRYEIQANGKVPDLKLKMDITTRVLGGYNIKIKKRIWK